jgi:hypothetical protein
MTRARASKKVSLLVAVAVIATMVPAGGVAASEGSVGQSQSQPVVQARLGSCYFYVGIALNPVGTAVRSNVRVTGCSGYFVRLGYAWPTSYGWQIGIYDIMKPITSNSAEALYSDIYYACPWHGAMLKGAVFIASDSYPWGTQSTSWGYVVCP